MLSITQKTAVLNLLQVALGDHPTHKKDENYAYHCPFCHHHKQKLEVDIESGNWHCWVCNARGTKIQNLVNRLDTSVYADAGKHLDTIYGKYNPTKYKSEQYVRISLPNEFNPLYSDKNVRIPEFKHAYDYLLSRGLRDYDIYKYKIGYCSEGIYSNRIIIPSYDEVGLLNYFIARDFYNNNEYKYKNPPLSRDIIGFDLFINWNEPINLVEGAFDAIAVRDNTIPLFGKFVLKKLKDKILLNSNEINIILDSDAIKSAVKTAEFFLDSGKKVKLIPLINGDPSILGYQIIHHQIKSTDYLDWNGLVKLKLL